MKQRIREKGLAHLGLIIAVIVVVVAVAFGGWYVWDKNKDDKGSDWKSNNSSQTNDNTENKVSKTFNCKDIFTVVYPESLSAINTDTGQCLVSNVGVTEMPPVGPLPPEQLGLFFTTGTTDFTASKDYLDDYIERSKEDYPLELKTQEEVELDNGNTAMLATVYGGHPVQHDFHFFVYIKNGMAITTSYPTNSNYKETALNILKSIQ